MSIPHGTAGGYTNHDCRCRACRDAWAVYHRERGYQDKYRDRYTSGPCLTDGCDRKRDRAYVTGFCHRCNIDLGHKRDSHKALA